MKRFSLIGVAALALMTLTGCMDVAGKRYSLVKFGDDPNEVSAFGALSSLGENKDRKASEEKATADSSDPVRQAIVLQDKNAVWGPDYGGTFFSADLYKHRKELVEKRKKTPVTERASLNTDIAQVTDDLKANELAKTSAKIKALSEVKTTNDADKTEIESHIAWLKQHKADVTTIPAKYDGADFSVASFAAKKGGDGNLASKQ